VLALGIGLNAWMFSLVYAIGLAGRAFAEPDRVVQLYSSTSNQPDSYRPFSYHAYQAIAGSDAFSGVLAHNPTLVGVSEGGEARRTFGVLASQNYFDVLGVPLVRGRGFTAEESRPGQDIPVVVVTYGYWQRRGLDTDLVGTTLRVNERVFTIIGVTPPGFSGTMTAFGPDLFFPLGVFHSLHNDFAGQAARGLERADAYNLFLVGRLAAGVSLHSATTRLTAAAAGLARSMPAEYHDARVTAAPLPRFGTSTSPGDEGAVTTLGAMLMGLTGAVLLTVCLNLAAMLLARGRARRKELAIRLALGGSRARIVRQLLIEGLVLSVAGGMLGAALAAYGVRMLQQTFAAILPVSIVVDGAGSPMVVGVTLGFCVLATAWFALAPALRHSRADVLADLKGHAGEDPVTPRRRLLPRHPLVAAQVALSLALLIAAGLFVRMAQTAMSVDLRFDADATVLAEVDTALAGYETPRALAVIGDVERRLAALPGVASAGVAPLVPLGLISISKEVRRAGIDVPVDSKPDTAEAGRAFDVPWNAVSRDYFSAVGVRVLSGRAFSEVEAFDGAAQPVAIVDEVLARRLWPADDALGQRIQFADRDSDGTGYEVVGIVAPTRGELFQAELPGAVFVPFARGALGPTFFHVRPTVPTQDLTDVVRRAVREAAPGLPLFSVRTFDDHVHGSIEYWALGRASLLFAVFGAAAMTVALVGIYGVMAHAVVRRTREIGIRMAVGAEPSAVRRMILGESLALTLGGVAMGLVLGLGVGRLLASVFVDVAAFDALTFTAVPVGFVAAAVAAAWTPARRATRVNPLAALRAE
jgi:predicted permease